MDIDTAELEPLLKKVSEETPCGADLEYDNRFIAMEEAAQGKPERQIGEVIEPATPPEWKEVAGFATDILHESKDLRSAVHLAAAWTNLHGVNGLAQGLRLVAELLERYWDCVHPELDADDGYDPTIRMNVLAGLADPARILRPLSERELLCAKGLGCFSLVDWRVASGQVHPEGESKTEPLSLDLIHAIFEAASSEDLVTAAAAPSHAQEQLQRITHVLRARVSDTTLLPDFDRLDRLLSEIREVFRLNTPTQTGPERVETAAQTGETPDAHSGGPAVTSSTIRSPQDVLRALDAISTYYERHEPSSPIPILMHRARQLVNRDFMDIIRNLVPDALRQIEELRGPEEENQ